MTRNLDHFELCMDLILNAGVKPLLNSQIKLSCNLVYPEINLVRLQIVV